MKSIPLKYIKLTIIILIFISTILVSCVHKGEQDTMLQFADCPDSPNCVSSLADQEDAEHYIQPYKLKLSTEKAFPRLVEYLESRSDVKILKREEGVYIHAVFISKIMRFKDDVEFRFKSGASAGSVIDIRSASRVGHSDFGANRSRMEEIREYFDGLQ